MKAGSPLGSNAVSTTRGCSMGGLATSLLGSDVQGRTECEVVEGTVSLLGSSVPVIVCWGFMVSLLGSGHKVL